MTCQSQVIYVFMQHNSSANDARRSNQFDQVISKASLYLVLTVGFYVAHIANVTDLRGLCSVVLFEGIKVASCADTAVCVVAKFVNVETVFTELVEWTLLGLLPT